MNTLAIYNSGADAVGAIQSNSAACLGGKRSNTRVRNMTWIRLSPIYGLRVLDVAGRCGVGVGTLAAEDSDYLTWLPPGETTPSAATSVPYGSKVFITHGTGKWILVERGEDVDLVGTESITLRDTFHNAIGGPDVEIAGGATDYSYSAVFLHNTGTATITYSITSTSTQASGAIAYAFETPSSNAIQEIIDSTAEPTGRSWLTSGAGYTLAAGASMGLWLRRTCVDTHTGPVDGLLTITYSHGAYTGLTYDLRCVRRVGVTGREQYELYVGVDAAPDFTAAPEHTFTGTTETYAYTLSASHTYQVEVLKRNKFDVRGIPHQVTEFEVDADGNILQAPPSAPLEYALNARPDGTMMLSAIYALGSDDVSIRANKWLIYVTDDGTDPDPDTDTPEIEDISANGNLDYELGPYTDGQTIKAIVRTRYYLLYEDEDENEIEVIRDSTNTTIVSAVADVWNGGVSRPVLSFGQAYGQDITVPARNSISYVNQSKNIFWLILDDDMQLWNDDALILRVNSQHAILTTYDVNQVAGVSGATGGTGVYDFSEWVDTTNEVFYVCVGTTRAMKIDCTNGVIYLNELNTGQTVTDSTATGPLHAAYTETLWQQYDDNGGTWCTYAILTTAELNVLGDWKQKPTEAECLA